MAVCIFNLRQEMRNGPTIPDVELVLSAVLDKVLVAADTRGLHGLGGQLLQFIGHLYVRVSLVTIINK